MCCSHMQHATGDCVWYVITSYKYCGLGEPVEEAGGWQIRCKRSTAETVIKLAEWGSFKFFKVAQAQVNFISAAKMSIFFPPYFISPSPWANTILYSCYLCKQCALFLFCTAWILLCPTETRPPEPIELSLFLTPPQFFRSNSRLYLTEEAFFGLFWDRQQSSCTDHIEKGRKSNAWMIERERVNFQSKTCSAGSGWCFTAVH